jgi:hypothetical protein
MKYPGTKLTISFAACMITLIGTVRASDLPSEWMPNLDDVASVEATIRMPAGSSSLKKYIRYYAGTVAKGHRVLLGHFELGPTANGADGEVRLVRSKKDLPVVYDGGCSIISFRYDMTEKRVLNLSCNGVA